MKEISIDFSKATLKRSIITLPTELGYDINIKLFPILKLQEQIGQNKEPGFIIDLVIEETTLTEYPNAIKTEESLKKFLKEQSFIPKHFHWKDLLIGFTYGSPQDEHKWMLQMRLENQSIFDTLIIENAIDVNCPTSTHSWFEGIWHGRMVITKRDLKSIREISPGHVEIIGDCGGNPEGDKSLLPEGADKIIIRYDILKNMWYAHIQDKEGKELKVLQEQNMDFDIPMKGRVDRKFKKPKVTEVINVEDIASINYRSNRLVILGK